MDGFFFEAKLIDVETFGRWPDAFRITARSPSSLMSGGGVS
jgi:hypothetical protein